MDKIVIRGGRPLNGSIHISGAKNAVLTLMPCALLTDEPLTLRNLPRLADVDSFGHLLNQLGVVKRRIVRAEKAAVDKLARFGVATIHEAMGRVGLMKTCMRPIYSGALVSGTAVTVLLHPGDNWIMHVLAEQIQPGDIVL